MIILRQKNVYWAKFNRDGFTVRPSHLRISVSSYIFWTMPCSYVTNLCTSLVALSYAFSISIKIIYKPFSLRISIQFISNIDGITLIIDCSVIKASSTFNLSICLINSLFSCVCSIKLSRTAPSVHLSTRQSTSSI